MTASADDRANSLADSEDAFARDLEDLRARDAGGEALSREISVRETRETGETRETRAMGDGLVRLSEALEPVAPAQGARERLLASVSATGRLARFAEATAKLLDLGIDRAQALLDQLADESVFTKELPGIAFFWCPGGPAVANAVRGFVRVEAGTQFPDHEHMGDEIVLVLQGSFVDTTRGLTFTAGDTDVMKAGTSHAYYVPEGGPDLLKLSVTQVGLRALGHTYLPRE